MLHNEHVLKYMRWRVFLAEQSGRLMALTFWAQWHNDELAKRMT